MMQRYSYGINGIVSAIAALLIGSAAAGAFADDLATLRQNYVDQGYGMFLHYNMGTHTGDDWAHSGLNVNTFTPTGSIATGTDQWAAVAKAAGMTYGVLTTKHHDGFSIYDTALSTYDIASTSWYNDPTNVNYQTDIVQSYADSFRAQGLGVGLYYSIWDKANGLGPTYYGDEPTVTQKTSAEATAYVKAELGNLLTSYGQIDVLWTDGWGWETGYSYVNYDQVYAYIKEVSPNTLLLNNDHEYNLAHTDIAGYEVSPMPPADNTLPSEICTTIRADGHWFYRDSSVDSLRSATTIASQIQTANSRNATYLLDVPPDQSCLIPESSVQRLMDVKAALNPVVATGIAASVQNSGSHIVFNSTHAPVGAVVFGNAGTFDGIAFSKWSAPFTTPLSLGSGISVVANANTNPVYEFGGGQQYQTGAYTTGNSDEMLTFSGLDSDKTYLFQFGYFDDRHNVPYDFFVILTLDDGSSITQELRFGDSTPYDYALLSVTMTGSTSLQLLMPGSTAIGPSLCSFAVSVVAVPEPSAWVLLTLGMIGLLVYSSFRTLQVTK